MISNKYQTFIFKTQDIFYTLDLGLLKKSSDHIKPKQHFCEDNFLNFYIPGNKLGGH